jgi:hypothetical protein
MQELFLIPFFIAINPIPAAIKEMINPCAPLKENTKSNRKIRIKKFLFL